MKKVIVTLLFLGLCVGSVYAGDTEKVGEFHRFVWVEEITIPLGTIVSIEPIDTSKFKTLIVQFTEVPGQPFNLKVFVESRIFEDENFRITGDVDGNKTSFTLSNTSIEEPAKLVCGIYGTETKLDIVNTGSASVTLKITAALIKGASAFPPLQRSNR